MDNQETANCFNDVKETFLNTQLAEELSLLTPRDIRETINSWATTSTDKERVGELIFEWLKDEYPDKKGELSSEVKHDRLLLTISNAKKYLDSILTKRDRKAEDADPERFNSLTPEEQEEHLNTLPSRVRGEDHGKCNMEEYKDNMDYLLNMVIPTTRNNKTKLLKLLDKMGYGYNDELNGYLFLFSFLSELMRYEFIICREIIPYTEEIRSFKRYKHDPEDKVWEARLNYYKNIGVRNRHRHSATLNSNKWAISFEDFAKLYRKILGLSNKAISTPLQ